MSKITSRPDHGVGIEEQGDKPPSILYQVFFDEIAQKLNDNLLGDSVRLMSYTVATLPAVPDATLPGLIFVSDETGGAVPAFSDGTNWRRVTDRTIVS